MGFKDSRLGKIVDVFTPFVERFKTWLISEDVSDATVADAIKTVNRDVESEDEIIGDNVAEATNLVMELNAKEAEKIFDREDTVGPVFSATEDNRDVQDDPAVALNQALEDETMKYVNGNPVELHKVEPQKLAKGGKERERIK